MFDRARISGSPETSSRGPAGRVGIVMGFTTPSVTGVDPIGGRHADAAINVQFDESGEAFWFAPHLIEFVDHAAGTKIKVKGRTWIRKDSGDWTEAGEKEMSQPPPLDYKSPSPHSLSPAVIGSILVGGLGLLSLLHSLWDSFIFSILGVIFGSGGVITRRSAIGWFALALNLAIFLLSILLLVRLS